MANAPYFGGTKQQKKSSVMNFQKQLGVKQDGLWGPISQAAYDKSLLGDSSSASGLGTIPTSNSAGGYKLFNPVVNTSQASSDATAMAGFMSSPSTTDQIVSKSIDVKTPIDATIVSGGGSGSLSSYLPSGWFDNHSNGDVFNTKSDNTGSWMKSGMFSDSEAKLGDFKSLEAAQAAGYGKDLTADQFRQSQFDQGRLDSQNFNNYAGMGLGALQLGASLFSTFGSGGSMDMNKKNIELMDGQIANNNDIMATRKARAADITKYFG